MFKIAVFVTFEHISIEKAPFWMKEALYIRVIYKERAYACMRTRMSIRMHCTLEFECQPHEIGTGLRGSVDISGIAELAFINIPLEMV